MFLLAAGLSSHATAWQVALLTAVSFGVGVLGGFVGLALGTMRLPALLLMGVPPPVAAGTNILVSTLSAATGTVRHWRAGRVSLRVTVVMGVPSVVGAFAGGFASGLAPEGLLIGLAGGFVTWQGIELVARGRREAGGKTGAPSATGPGGTAQTLTPRRLAAEGSIGLAIGLLGGAVGLILGSIRLPALLRILRLDPRVAAGTNLCIGFVMGIFGGLGHLLRGDVDYVLLVLMGLAGMVGAYCGAQLTGRVRLTTLIATTGGVLAAIGVLLLWDAYRRTVT